MALVSYVRTERANFRQYFSKIWTITLTGVDITSLNDAVGAAEDVTITGLALGDMVLGLSSSISTAGIIVTAAVNATDTMSLWYQNESGGTVDLAAATITILIGRPDSSMFRANNYGM